MPKTAYQPSHASPVVRSRALFTIRLWSVRHSRGLEIIYKLLAKTFLKLHPFWSWVGYQRAEKPVVFIEKAVKGLLFDCRMCGQCVLSDTGMSCPMNCPKSLRNGPCGGVRANGNCEVEPDMPCVWVEAWKGSQNMQNGNQILKVQEPVNHSYRGSSSWLRVTAEDAARIEKEKMPTVATGDLH
ncbi:MAG: methylenetetrahydrofolate reductase C-terminal domain-containing protein [Sneathiella sp.]|uniref:methylenetetrahydrofolate reductase C-terminal domain-containing protein n=1 Tax=Sneathiella sp. TaxID=1964365 RepID=UPI003002EB63